jgi:tetratricopeptide (TPR) repeat protein/DNA-binding CsgD family transcriptional regulator
MKGFLFFLLLFGLSFQSKSQIDNEKKLLLRQIEEFNEGNLDSLIEYKCQIYESKFGIDETIKILEEINAKNWGFKHKSAATLVLSEFYTIKGGAENLRKAESKLREGYQFAIDNNDCRKILFLERLFRLYLNLKPQKDSLNVMIYELNEATNSSNCPVYKIDAYVNLANRYYNARKEYFSSIETLKKALSLADSLKVGTFRLGQIYDLTGFTFYQMRNYEMALQYWHKAAALWKNKVENRQFTNMLNSIGLCHKHLGRADSALHFYDLAIQNAKKLSDTIWVGIASGNKGEVYFKLQDYDKAMTNRMTDLDASLKYGAWTNAIFAHVAVAKILLEKNQLEKAYAQIQEAEKLLAQKINWIQYENNQDLIRIKAQINEGYSRYFQKKNDYEKAFNHFVLFKNMSDSLVFIEMNEKIILKELFLETQQHESQLKLLKEGQKKELLFYYVLIISVGAATVILILTAYSYRLKHKKSLAESQRLETEKALLNSEAEKLTQEKQILAIHSELLESQSKIEQVKAEKLTEELAIQENAAKLKEDKMKEQLKEKEREMMSHVLQINQKNEILNQIKKNLSMLKNENEVNKIYIKEIDKIVKNNLSNENDWEKFSYFFVQVHPNFFKKLLEKFPELTQNELKHCSFMRANLSVKETAAILNVSPKTVEMARYRIKKKVGLNAEDDLLNILLSL